MSALPHPMDFFYKFRRFLSGPPAIIIAIIIITTPITRVVERMVPKDLFEMPVTLVDTPPPPPPPPPQVKPVQPQEVQPVVTPQVQDVITKESVVIEIKPAPPPEPAQRIETPPVVAPIVAGNGPNIGQIQAGYEHKIKGYLESIKRYPTSREARIQRPTGRVGLWIEVNRDGSLKEVGIAKTSDFIILDNAALATVRQGKFPPFPLDTYPGEPFRRFTVTLEYNLEQPG